MCGIAAAIQHSDPLNRVGAMLALLRHRGDSSDPPEVFGNGTAALGTERLRIVDFAGGRQPFTSYDGQWKVVLDGEIYNHACLREVLAARGIPFRSQCDTEVLANLIATEGSNASLRLDGMFAFVAIHREGHRWIAARDPVGIKPLYLIQEGNALYFASEIQPLLAVSPTAPVQIFPPGEWRTESDRGRHWMIQSDTPCLTSSLDHNTLQLKQLLERAVSHRLPPDLPCAVLFSGGIDSTLVFHIARGLHPDVCGFYIGNPHGRDYEHAKRYASHFDAKVEFIPYSDNEVFGLIPDVVRTLETFEPNQVRSGIFSYLLSKAVKEFGYRVALCGEGADELFCGYPELYQMPRTLPRSEQQSLIQYRRKLYLNDLHKTQLQRVDRCAMHHALEVRVPFLDRAILDFALRLPVSHLVDLDAPGPTANKRIMRHLYRYYPEIPLSFASREKVVFVDGSGMGDNGPNGPLYDYSEAQAKAENIVLESGSFPGLRNLEEAYYFNLLSRSHQPIRLPFLCERAHVNTI
jgi:asparagine synthase (glutamine-hydrolysing)